MTHYDTLGIPSTATPEEIRAAYRRCAFASHPDREADPLKREAAREEFQRVHAAFEVLSDPRRRAVYDAESAEPRDLGDVIRGMGGAMGDMRSAATARDYFGLAGASLHAAESLWRGVQLVRKHWRRR